MGPGRCSRAPHLPCVVVCLHSWRIIKVSPLLHRKTLIRNGVSRLQASRQQLRELYDARLSDQAHDYEAQLEGRAREVAALRARVAQLEEAGPKVRTLCGWWCESGIRNGSCAALPSRLSGVWGRWG